MVVLLSRHRCEERRVETLRTELGSTTGRSKLDKEINIRSGVVGPLRGDIILVEDGLNRADGLTRATVDALVRLDVEHPAALVDAVNGTLFDTGLVLQIDTGLSDDVGHRRSRPSTYLFHTIVYGSRLVSRLPEHNLQGVPPVLEGSGAKAVMRISPADLGRRVTVRYDGAEGPSEAVGILTDWTDELVIVGRTGKTTRFPVSRLMSARVVRPEISAYDLQSVADQMWSGVERIRLGGWTLRRSTTGQTQQRANSVQIAGVPDRPIDEALSFVRGWYSQHGIRASLQVVDNSLWDNVFSAHGWDSIMPSVAMIHPRLEVRGTHGFAAVERDSERDAVWIDIRESPGPNSDILGTGRGTIVDGWLCISGVETRAAARRRGVATALMNELAAWALRRRISQGFLQVSALNAAGLGLYDSLGYVRHHGYHYWIPNAD